MYTVTRQIQWPEGAHVVEVSIGGIDYCNPDALAEKYPGEMQEYEDPREAVEAAIRIRKLWRADEPDKTIDIGIGATGGMTAPFEPCISKVARRWARREFEWLIKCPTCGKIMQDAAEWFKAGTFYPDEFIPDENESDRYCSESCAEKDSSYLCEYCNEIIPMTDTRHALFCEEEAAQLKKGTPA